MNYVTRLFFFESKKRNDTIHDPYTKERLFLCTRNLKYQQYNIHNQIRRYIIHIHETTHSRYSQLDGIAKYYITLHGVIDWTIDIDLLAYHYTDYCHQQCFNNYAEIVSFFGSLSVLISHTQSSFTTWKTCHWYRIMIPQ